MESEKDILDLIVDACTDERLSRIADRDAHYREADWEYSEAVKRFETMDLTKEQRRVIITMNDAFAAQSAAYADVAYRQGLIDGIDLIMQAQSEKEKEKES